MNLLHLSREEPVLDRALNSGSQRRWAWFSSAMCKPVLIRRAVAWSAGFHCADAPLNWASLYLIHLRYADRHIAAARLARTRAMAWADLAAGAHQRIGDTALNTMLDGLERMDRRAEVAFAADAAPLSEWLAAVERSRIGRETAPYRIALDVECYELWRIPERFATQF